MNEIRSLLKVASARLEASSFLRQLHFTASIAAVAALALMIADRLPGAAFVPWVIAGPVLGVGAVVVAIALWAKSRRAELTVAMLVDERLDLREKLSTALNVAGQDDPFARAAVEDAIQAARDPRNHELAKRRFVVEPPRNWWVAPALVCVAVMLSFVQPLNVFAREEQLSPEVQQTKMEVAQTLDAVVQAIREQPQLSEELADLLGDLTQEPTDRDALRTPEQVRRDAIKRVSDLNERLEEIISGERGKTVNAIERAMKQLKPPDSGPGKELAEAMSKGDFKGAQAALETLMEKIESGEMSEAEKQQLIEQLQDIAEQLQKLAEQQQELENALKNAGLDPQLAQNPEALKQAIQNSDNLNDQQKQQLQQMAQAQQAASEMCKGLGQACMNMAAGLQAGEMGAAGQMGQQLSQLEQMQMMLQQARLAQGQCQGSCQGLGQNLSLSMAMSMSQGMGMNHGIGAGDRPMAPSPTRTREVRAEGETGEGDIIARMLVDGPQTVGESRVSASQIVAKIVEGIEQALVEDQLPRRYHDAQKHYFGELEKQTKAMEAEREKAPPAPEKKDE